MANGENIAPSITSSEQAQEMINQLYEYQPFIEGDKAYRTSMLEKVYDGIVEPYYKQKGVETKREDFVSTGLSDYQAKKKSQESEQLLPRSSEEDALELVPQPTQEVQETPPLAKQIKTRVDDWYKDRGGMTPEQKADAFATGIGDLQAQVEQETLDEEGYNKGIEDLRYDLGLLKDGDNIVINPKEVEDYRTQIKEQYEQHLKEVASQEDQDGFFKDLLENLGIGSDEVLGSGVRIMAMAEKGGNALLGLMGVSESTRYQDRASYESWVRDQWRANNQRYDEDIITNVLEGNMGVAAKQTVLSVAENLPLLALLASGNAAGATNVTLGYMGADKAANEYLRSDAEGDLPELTKILNALGKGFSEVIFEGTGTVHILNNVRRAVQQQGSEAVRDQMIRAFTPALERNVALLMKGTNNMVREGASEMATELTDNIMDLASGRDVNIGDGVADAGIVGAVIGMGMSAPMAKAAFKSQAQINEVAKRIMESIPEEYDIATKAELAQLLFQSEVLAAQVKHSPPGMKKVRQEELNQIQDRVLEITGHEKTKKKPGRPKKKVADAVTVPEITPEAEKQMEDLAKEIEREEAPPVEEPAAEEVAPEAAPVEEVQPTAEEVTPPAEEVVEEPKPKPKPKKKAPPKKKPVEKKKPPVKEKPAKKEKPPEKAPEGVPSPELDALYAEHENLRKQYREMMKGWDDLSQAEKNELAPKSTEVYTQIQAIDKQIKTREDAGEIRTEAEGRSPEEISRQQREAEQVRVRGVAEPGVEAEPGEVVQPSKKDPKEVVLLDEELAELPEAPLSPKTGAPLRQFTKPIDNVDQAVDRLNKLEDFIDQKEDQLAEAYGTRADTYQEQIDQAEEYRDAVYDLLDAKGFPDTQVSDLMDQKREPKPERTNAETLNAEQKAAMDIVDEMIERLPEESDKDFVERKKEAKNLIGEGIHDIMRMSGGVVQFAGETKPELKDAVRKISEGVWQLGAVNIEEFMAKVKDAIKKSKSIPKEQKKSLVTYIDDNANVVEEVYEAKAKQRKFSKRLSEDVTLNEEFREAMKDDKYLPTKLSITQDEAQTYIKVRGMENAILDVVATDNGKMQPRVRVAMAQEIIKELDRQVRETEDAKAKQELMDKQIDVANAITEFGTVLGQGIQAFTLWARLSPGALERKHARDVKKALGRDLTEKEKKDIKRMSKEIEKAPEGAQKNRKIQDYLKYQMQIEGIHWSDVGLAIWYANILSGYKTQLLNILANAAEMGGEIATGTIYNMATGKFRTTAKMYQGLFNGLYRGLSEGWDVLKTGHQPLKSAKVGADIFSAKPSVLEALPKKGVPGYKAAANIALQNWKYVQRVMMATDMFFFSGLKGMRSYELASREVNGRGKSLAEANRLVNEKLFRTPEQLKAARAQATKEGMKPGSNQHRLRVWEIMDQTRPEEVLDDANDFASRGTFNYPAEGIIGYISDQIAQMAENAGWKGVKPIKAIVPFTRIVTNVMNRYLDYTPWGAVRAGKGSIGLLAPKDVMGGQYYTKLSPEQRVRTAIKSLAGTAAMTSFWLLSQPGDDDEEPAVQITSNGYGDYQKNYELRETGWMPYSVKINDKWYSYQNTPVGIALSMIGFVRDAERYKGVDLENEDLQAKLGIAMANLPFYLSDMTFLRGVAEFFSAFSEGTPGAFERYFQRKVPGIAKSAFVPNLYIQLNRDIFASDIDQADNMKERLLRDLPVSYDDKKPILNNLGEVVDPKRPRWISEVDSDPVWQLLIKNNALVGKPNKTTEIYDPVKRDRRRLTEDEYYEYAKIRGQYIRSEIERGMKQLQKMEPSEVRSEMTYYKRLATAHAKEEIEKMIYREMRSK